MDSTSAHWNSEASAESRDGTEKALLFPSLFLACPETGRSARISAIRRRPRKRYPFTLRCETSWCATYAVWENCRIKSKRYQGLLFHCVSRSVPRSKFISSNRSVIGDVSATSGFSRKYWRAGSTRITFRTRSRRRLGISESVCIWDDSPTI